MRENNALGQAPLHPHIRRDMRSFSSARSPPVPVGRQPSITPIMVDALCDHVTTRTSEKTARGRKWKVIVDLDGRCLEYIISRNKHNRLECIKQLNEDPARLRDTICRTAISIPENGVVRSTSVICR